MASTSELYFQSAGLAFQAGVDDFGKVMPRHRFADLHHACLETRGFKWVDANFVRWVVCLAVRAVRSEPEMPTCTKGDCKWRMKYADLPPQKNALRVEIWSPADRCGWNLKAGRMGGRPDDYLPCPYSQK